MKEHADYIPAKKVEKKRIETPKITTAVQEIWPPKVTGFLGVWGEKMKDSTAQKILALIKNGNGTTKGEWKEAIEKVRSIKDKDAKNAEKNKLWSIKFQGEFSKLGDDGLKSFSGLVVIDLDHLDNLAEQKEKLFSSPHIVAVFVSPSGDGLKVLVDCRGYNGQTYKIAESKAIKLIADLIDITADPNAKGVSRYCFISYDPNLKQKWNTTPIEAPTAEEIKEEEEKGKRRSLADAKTVDLTTPYGKTALNLECEKASEAQDGTRHQTLNTSAYLIGTLVGGGEVNYEDAIDALEEAGTACGLPTGEVTATVSRAVLEGMQSPRNADSKDEELDEVAVELSEAGKEQEPKSDPKAPTPLDIFLNATSDSAGVSKALVDAKAEAKADGRLKEYAEGFTIAPVAPVESKTKAEPIAEPETVTFDSENSKTPWRKVTTKEIEDIIRPSALWPIVEALGIAYNPALPLEMTLVKAIVLAGCALSGSRSYSKDVIGDEKGIDLARVVIDTAGGQSSNVYGMIVSQSSSGKDVGGMMPYLASKNNWLIGGGGSREGVLDALMEKTNGLLVVNETAKMFDSKNWQYGIKEIVTENWNRGWFSEPMSQRTKIKRESPYCYPNFLGAIQPDIITRLARTQDIESGFMGRILYSYYERPEGEKRRKIRNGDLKGYRLSSQKALERYMAVCGRFQVPEDYAVRLTSVFDDGGADHESHYMRLVNEYLPRIALMLSIQSDSATAQSMQEDSEAEEWSLAGQVEDPQTSLSCDLCNEIPQEFFDKAERVVMWFFAMAEKTLGTVRDSEKDAERERAQKAIYHHIRKFKGKATKSTIARNCRKQCGNSEERKKHIADLLEAEWIAVTADRKFYRIGTKEDIPRDW